MITFTPFVMFTLGIMLFNLILINNILGAIIISSN